MKNILLIFAFLIVLISTGCYKTINTMNSGKNLVISYPARVDYNTVSSGINYWNKALLSFSDMGKASETVLVSINIPKALSQDVQVTIAPNQTAFDSYNTNPVFNTTYTMMPATYYNIVNQTINIPAGKTDTTVQIQFFPSKMDISKTGYLLPLSVTSATGIEVNQTLNTVFFHIEKDPFPPFPTTAWSVVSFSSQEAVGEGANNGRVIFAFDNNPSSFWHSKWQGGTDPLPYWFIIDMNASNVLHGVMILDRQGVGSEGRPRNMTLEVSNDLSNWTLAGSFTGADQNASYQKFAFANPTAASRYFRLTISSVYGGVSYSNIAELKVY